MKNLLLMLNLHLFDGGAAGAGGAGAAAASGAGDAGAAAGTDGKPANGRAGKNESPVLYGIQDNGDGQAQTAAEDKTPDPKEREAKFREMITGEYKDLYTKETQRIINDRFRETKGLQESLDAQAPIMDMLRDRYGVDDIVQLADRLSGDNAMWEDAAEDAGMSVEQYRQYKTMERQNHQLLRQQEAQLGRERAQRQVSAWIEEANSVKEHFPEFDLNAERQNPEFMRLLQSQVPMEHAYKLIHMDEIMQQNAADAQKRTVETIRTRGSRPPEAGASSQTGVTVKSNVSQLSRADRRAIAEKVRRGESIKF